MKYLAKYSYYTTCAEKEAPRSGIYFSSRGLPGITPAKRGRPILSVWIVLCAIIIPSISFSVNFFRTALFNL